MSQLNLPGEPPVNEPPDDRFEKANIAAVIESLRIDLATVQNAHAQLDERYCSETSALSNEVEALQQTLKEESQAKEIAEIGRTKAETANAELDRAARKAARITKIAIWIFVSIVTIVVIVGLVMRADPLALRWP
jgi:t-SNARE complex subunit (syntaxin)